MSVLKSKRHPSRAEYVHVADQIFVEVWSFLIRLSNREQRFLSQDTMHLASKVLDNCEMANSIFVTDSTRHRKRESHLIEARAALSALDVHMTHIWEVLMMNPEGCFSTSQGKIKSASEAVTILNKMADSLGDKINKEMGLLNGVLTSDKKQYNELMAKEKQEKQENKEG